jgi:hypothetical protein
MLGLFNNFHHFTVNYLAHAAFGGDMVKATEYAAFHVDQVAEVSIMLSKKYVAHVIEDKVAIYDRTVTVTANTSGKIFKQTVKIDRAIEACNILVDRFLTKTTAPSVTFTFNNRTPDWANDYSLTELMSSNFAKKEIVWKSLIN